MISMDKEKSARWKILSRVFGLIVFIIIMFILNHYSFNNALAIEIIGFLHTNIALIIIMSIMLLIADMFYALIIPFNLPAPIFGAVGSIFIVTFIFRIFGFIGVILHEEIFVDMSWLRWIIYPLVFIIVLVSGYVSILFHAFQTQPKKEKVKETIVDITPKRHKAWKDVGGEFRNMWYDLFHKVRNNINKKRK